MKITMEGDVVTIEVHGKIYLVTTADGLMMIYSDNGVEIVEESKLGRWVKVK